jgi:hypothetical protein
MTREQKLEAEARKLEKWALRNKLLEPGESIEVTISIQKHPLLEVRLVSKRLLKPVNNLSEKEWGEILAQHMSWNPSELDFLRTLQKNKNAPTDLPQEAFSAQRWKEDKTSRGRMNQKLRSFKLPYLLQNPGRLPNHKGFEPMVIVKTT